MREFELRDLQTGAIIRRNGADTREILKRCKPGRKQVNARGNPLKNPHAGYTLVGQEPKGWVNPNPAEEAEPQLPAELADESGDELDNEADEEFEE